ncbi:MAG: hypothetical protein ABI416_04950 [Ginsengibacter sp.]
MKNISILLLVMILSGCGSQNTSPEPAGSQNRNRENGTVTDTSPGSNEVAKGSQASSNAGKTQARDGVVNENNDVISDPADKSKNNDRRGATENNPLPVDVDTKSSVKSDDRPTGISLSSKGNPAAAGYLDDGGKTIIYVGVFATWKPGDGDQFDGSYDSTHSLFVLCGSNHCQEVPHNEINYQVFGSCDTAKGDRIKLFKITTNGTLNPDGIRIKVTGNRGIIKEGLQTRIIELDPVTIKRIYKADANRNTGAFEVTPVLKNQKDAKISQVELQPHDNLAAKAQVDMTKPATVINDAKIKAVEEKRAVIPKQQIDSKIQVKSPVANPGKVIERAGPAVIQPELKVQPAIRKIAVDTAKKVYKIKMSGAAVHK